MQNVTEYSSGDNEDVIGDDMMQNLNDLLPLPQFNK